jgi:hypothetical protein
VEDHDRTGVAGLPPEVLADVQAGLKADHDARTAELVLAVDDSDEECARHLTAWAMTGERTGMGAPVHAVGGPALLNDEDRTPYDTLRSAVFVSCVAPPMLARFMADVAGARWQRPELVQLLVKDGSPHFVLYMLSDGELHRMAPPRPGLRSTGAT